MNALAAKAPNIGTPAVDPYGNTGFVAAVLPARQGIFTIGRGMEPERYQLEICFPNRVTVLGDGIAAPMIERARGVHPITAEEVAELREIAKAAEAQALAGRQEAQARGDALRAAFLVEAREKTPEWAAAVIVAEMVHDQSDVQTDYFGSTTGRVIILGFSRHKRDLFPEMRKAALNRPETAFLATAPDDAEHREKYSMGGGFYLKAGWRNSDGWRISKRALYNGAESVPVGEWALEPAAGAAPITEAAPVVAPASKARRHLTCCCCGESAGKWEQHWNRDTGYGICRACVTWQRETGVEEAEILSLYGVEGVNFEPAESAAAPIISGARYAIEEHTHTKRGFQMWIVALSDRVERAEYERLLSAAKASGGWYSRKWGSAPAGFAFKSDEAARDFATSQLGTEESGQ
jgi:hypothetical protein